MSRLKQKFIIRADGGEMIGMGHVMRTSVLAKELSQFFDIVYIMLEEYVTGIAYIQKLGYEVIVIPKNKLMDTIIQQEAVGIITDNYDIDETYMQQVKKYYSVVGYIDDNAEKSFNADFILNQNFGSEEMSYETNEECKLFLGSQYVMLKSLYRQSNAIVVKKEVEEILITVGGSDPLNVTETILKNISNLEYKFHVVIGPAFSYEEDLYKKYNKLGNIIFYKEPNMCNLMKRCDIAISSCGSTVYELGALGIPIIGISVADNQIPLAKRMNDEGCIIYLGDMRKTLIRPIYKALVEIIEDYDLRVNMQQKSMSVINKEGVQKVTKCIMEIVEEKLNNIQ